MREKPRAKSLAYGLRSYVGRISDSVMLRMIKGQQRRNTAAPIDALRIAPYGLDLIANLKETR
ncbi:MAG: hypothetical protein BVN35_06960 [Proteobacteria bacterium ST_bin11]|nr:MAG: hypothetical protein BVN35_06960 [Proteobacteria bacterium ST_bin11]